MLSSVLVVIFSGGGGNGNNGGGAVEGLPVAESCVCMCVLSCVWPVGRHRWRHWTHHRPSSLPNITILTAAYNQRLSSVVVRSENLRWRPNNCVCVFVMC